MLLAIDFPDISPIAFHLGPFPIRWYGIAYVVSIAAGWLIARRLVRTDPVASTSDIDDFVLYATVGIVVGGRLGNFILYYPHTFIDDPLEIFRIWHGGMAFHGGLLGMIVASLLFSWRRGIDPAGLADLMGFVAPIGIFVVRIANFVNGELWGRVTDVPWAVRFPLADDMPRHPSQIYEALAEGLLLFLVLWWMATALNAFRFRGLIFSTFLAGYGIGRSVCEFFRVPDGLVSLFGLSLTDGQAFSIPMIAIGLVGIFAALHRGAAPNLASAPDAVQREN